jgi:hypothetical protein
LRDFVIVVRLLEVPAEENPRLPPLSELDTKARQVVLQLVSEERGEVIDESSWPAVDYFVKDILKRAREDIHKMFQGSPSQEQMRKLTRRLSKSSVRMTPAIFCIICL